MSQSPDLMSSTRFVASLIRSVFIIPRDQQPCAVCERYACITEAHHVIPVKQLAKMCVQAGVTIDQLERLPVRYIWLCPNHHALFHYIESRRHRTKTLLECIDGEELHSLKIMWDLQNWDEVRKFLSEVRS